MEKEYTIIFREWSGSYSESWIGLDPEKMLPSEFCMFAMYLEKLWTDFDETFWVTFWTFWHKDKVINLLERFM